MYSSKHLTYFNSLNVKTPVRLVVTLPPLDTQETEAGPEK